MILGMTAFTFMHVLISLVAIASGLIVALGLVAGKRMNGLTALFLTTTVLTSVTGFLFPYHGFTPGIAVGIISMVVLAIAIYARYLKQMAGGWRKTYVVTGMIALYLNMFVLIAQSFGKIPALHALAPTQKEPPFAIAQVTLMLIFIVWTVLAAKRFHSQSLATA
ncbi:MAG TPA: hypothetical protein VK525_20810 [Candidatus Saccharimonadales bacterium]|nr:hypothetical protein [Candidatus Saccharimonadales bacterium]